MPIAKRHFYDKLSRYYWLIRLLDDCYKETALDAIKLRRKDRFLDIGCGDGSVLRQANERCPDAVLYGVDISTMMASRARKAAKANVSIGSCFFLPYKNNSFNVLFSGFVFDLFDEKEQQKALAGMSRVLVPGGTLVLINNSHGEGIFTHVVRFYALLAHIFPNLLLNKPMDTCSLIERSPGFKVNKRISLWFTEIVVCEKSIVKPRTI
ncbi:MAG: class I SAM-dependent methyltransferase [archaeon]|nr:class I SAM-dependent methyltransferase [archaeon]